jgi:hypothetical protein
LEDITQEEVQTVLTTLGNLPPDVFPCPRILFSLEIACQTGRALYDSLYLELAIWEQMVMVNEKFVC